jgi:hypothetical protein
MNFLVLLPCELIKFIDLLPLLTSSLVSPNFFLPSTSISPNNITQWTTLLPFTVTAMSYFEMTDEDLEEECKQRGFRRVGSKSALVHLLFDDDVHNKFKVKAISHKYNHRANAKWIER